MRQFIKDYYLFPIIALAFAGLATAQTAPQEVCVTIEHQQTLDKAAELCPILRASLPAHKQNPWSPSICLKEAAIRTYKELNREQTALALKLSLRNLDNLDTQVEPTPVPTATPIASPTTTPSPTP